MAAVGRKASTKATKPKTTKTAGTVTKTRPKTAKKKTETDEKKRKAEPKTAERYAKTAKAVSEDSEKKRKRLIKNEIRRLGDSLKDIPSEKRRLVKATIEDAAFLTVTMQELRDQIAREGTEVEYKNGENQYGTKQSPAVVSYLQMSQKLNAAMKVLLECQPKTEVKEVDDKFDDFIVERGNDD